MLREVLGTAVHLFFGRVAAPGGHGSIRMPVVFSRSPAGGGIRGPLRAMWPFLFEMEGSRTPVVDAVGPLSL